MGRELQYVILQKDYDGDLDESVDLGDSEKLKYKWLGSSSLYKGSLDENTKYTKTDVINSLCDYLHNYEEDHLFEYTFEYYGKIISDMDNDSVVILRGF